MRIAVLIPARISSKRLSRKNIKELNGKPLLFWSIDVALEVSSFYKICISTESQEVSDLVREYYSKKDISVLFRPDELATDKADLKDVCRHFLDRYPEVDILCLMMPTYPFRSFEKINREIVPALYSGQIDRVTSVHPDRYSTFDYWVKSDYNYIRMFKNQPLWCEAGNAAYSFMRRDYFYKDPHLWPYEIGEREFKVSTDFKESIDIDTMEDFKRAEKIADGFQPMYRPVKSELFEETKYIVPAGVDVAELHKYLKSKGLDLSLPVLILKSPPPYFTFLRIHEKGGQKDYKEQITNEIIANLPTSGHSQDFPEHFIQSSHYRILGKHEDRFGLIENTVPACQVLLYSDLKKWSGFVEPFFWERINP